MLTQAQVAQMLHFVVRASCAEMPTLRYLDGSPDGLKGPARRAFVCKHAWMEKSAESK